MADQVDVKNGFSSEDASKGATSLADQNEQNDADVQEMPVGPLLVKGLGHLLYIIASGVAGLGFVIYVTLPHVLQKNVNESAQKLVYDLQESVTLWICHVLDWRF